VAERLPSRRRQSAYGIVPDKDGSVPVAQEDYDAVLKIDANGNSSVAVADAKAWAHCRWTGRAAFTARTARRGLE
jgi:hypothetical protein